MKRNFYKKKRKKMKGGNNSLPLNPKESKMGSGDMEETIKSMNKAPIMHLLDYLLYTLYTLGGIFIYYPRS